MAVALGLIAIVSIFIYWRSMGEGYNPLGVYPIQTVEVGAEVTEGQPTLVAGQQINVFATKCNVSDPPTDVRVRIEWSWTTVDPTGYTSPPYHTTATLVPGCTAESYSRRMPEEVTKHVESLDEEGVSSSIWVVSGTETPIDKNGNDGEPRDWITQNFVIRSA